MASGKDISSQSSCSINYKCCKSKPFLHFVCIKCFNVFHKCCVPKVKRHIRFIKQNKIICCEEENSSDHEEAEKSILEKTIEDLNEDSLLKDRYINKLKAEHKLFLNEAMKREDDMNEVLLKQENTIKELKNIISNIKKTTEAKQLESKRTVSTQTLKSSKNVSVCTDLSMSNKNLIVQAFEDKNGNNIRQELSGINKEAKKQRQVIKKYSTTTGKILILADDFGRNINKIVYKKLPNKYQLETMLKPGATFQQTIENIDQLTKNYGLNDHVVIITGSNNFNKNTGYPSFRYICDKLKSCNKTNIIVATTPYKNRPEDRFIQKFNMKLNDFMCKLNNCIPGKIKVVEVNKTLNKKLSKIELGSVIASTIVERSPIKNLAFIPLNTNKNTLGTSQEATTLPTEVIDLISTTQDIHIDIIQTSDNNNKNVNLPTSQSVNNLSLSVETNNELHFLCPEELITPPQEVLQQTKRSST